MDTSSGFAPGTYLALRPGIYTSRRLQRIFRSPFHLTSLLWGRDSRIVTVTGSSSARSVQGMHTSSKFRHGRAVVPATHENVVAKNARISEAALASAGVHGSPGREACPPAALRADRGARR